MAQSPSVFILANLDKLFEVYNCDLSQSFQAAIEIFESFHELRREVSTDFAQLLLLNRYLMTIHSLIYNQMSSLENARLLLESTKAQVVHQLQLENLKLQLENLTSQSSEQDKILPPLGSKEDLLSKAVKESRLNE